MSEPDFLAQSAEPMTDDERHSWLDLRWREAQLAGCSHIRASRHPSIENLILLEGWKVRPDPQPEQDWQLTSSEHDK